MIITTTTNVVFSEPIKCKLLVLLISAHFFIVSEIKKNKYGCVTRLVSIIVFDLVESRQVDN